jgi:hypothetical protein
MKRIFYNISLVLIACLFFTTTMPAAALNKSIIPEDTQWIVHMDMEMFNKTQFKELLMKERDAMHWKWDNHDLIKEFNINPHKIYTVLPLLEIKRITITWYLCAKETLIKN